MLKIVPSPDDLANPAPKTVEKCSICDKKLNGKAALTAHLRRTHKIAKKDSVNKLYYCPVDGCCHSIDSTVPFSTLSAIKQHYKLTHGTARYKCSHCDRTFKTKYSCKGHEIECGVKYVCSCDIAYTTKRGLLEHIKRQNHQLPESLKSLFDSRKKYLRKSELKTASIQPKKTVISNKIILPKTSKKIKLLNVTSNNMNLLSNLPSSAFARRVQLITFPLTKQKVVFPKRPVRSQPTQKHVTNTLPQQKSVCIQFPTSTEQLTSPSLSKPILYERSGLPSSVEDDTDWFHRNISIQTEEHVGASEWMNLDDERILFENIATQTNESVFEQIHTEKDSTMCQTDWCHSETSNSNMVYHDFNYSQSQENINNTTELNVLPTNTVPYHANPQNDYTLPRYSSTICNPSLPSSSSNIETQTDKLVHQSSTETQTVQQQMLLDEFEESSLHGNATEISSLDVFLNNIETQTDMLLSPWSANQIATFVHSCTQTTPEADFLSEILDLDSHRC